MDDDFERRRELRRQKREEMRLEAERMANRRSEEDEEEAARERRRRARQEKFRGKDSEDVPYQPDNTELNNSHSVTVTETVSSSVVTSSRPEDEDEEEQALQERLAKREERRQRRMMEALDRQREIESPTSHYGLEESGGGLQRGRSYEAEEEVNSKEVEREEEKEQDIPREEVVVEKPQRSYLRGQESVEETSNLADEGEQCGSPPFSRENEVILNEVADDSAVVLETESENGTAGVREEKREVEREGLTENGLHEAREAERKRKEKEETKLAENEEVLTEDEDLMRKNKQPNGAVCDESPPKHKNAERTFSRGSLRSTEAPETDEADSEDARLEAERKLEELKRRRDEMESEEFEKMRQKQQEAEVELEELKRKREERRKVLEEEERRRKQEEAERKSKDEEEKRRMKEDIEKRRADAAERRQKVDDSVEGEARKPFKCVSPRGSSLKIGERAEFLNRSAQRSSVKASHTPVVSKIDNRLEQYTSAVQTNQEVKSPRSGAIDLPMVTDGIRNIKSMWEKGNVFASGGSPASTNKDAAVIKVGVAGRINDWLNKTPETGKTSGGRPADLKPGDVTSKRNLWENKGSPATKI
ncbi:caldesmon 1a isoform X2 [Triplophysa dalaica]|uniref:caldesmon 1a isoform X2 n=1 Tax=Triplophysa dalaica TaxID=1582913 RepID=UPI0024E01332|nr:caldesmon 1a isoform X2 [Triplophysa dalaica]